MDDPAEQPPLGETYDDIIDDYLREAAERNVEFPSDIVSGDSPSSPGRSTNGASRSASLSARRSPRNTPNCWGRSTASRPSSLPPMPPSHLTAELLHESVRRGLREHETATDRTRAVGSAV